jgi:hypothetical protein
MTAFPVKNQTLALPGRELICRRRGNEPSGRALLTSCPTPNWDTSLRRLGARLRCLPRREAAEQRQKVAHGTSRGSSDEDESSPGRGGRNRFCLSPLPGLTPIQSSNPQLTLWATLCRTCGAETNGSWSHVRLRNLRCPRRLAANFRSRQTPGPAAHSPPHEARTSQDLPV